MLVRGVHEGGHVEPGLVDAPALLVDVEDALAVAVLRNLREPFHDVHTPFLPALVEGPIDLLVPPDGHVLRLDGGEDLALAEELPVHPPDLAGVTPVAVDVG